MNTWSLNISETSDNQASATKTLCFNTKVESIANPDDDRYVTVVAFSNYGQEESINIDAEWNTNFIITENSTLTTEITQNSPQVFQFQPSIHYNSESDESYLL